MTFFFPLNLGVETTPSLNRERSPDFTDNPHRLSLYDAWREGVELQRREFEPKPEAGIFDEILHHDHYDTTIIVGEPGSGKTRLMEQWFVRSLHRVHEFGLCTPVPVLVRLRIFNDDDSITELRKALRNNHTLQNLLWNHGLSETALPDLDYSYDYSTIYQSEQSPYYPVLWLFDGLDEIDTSFLRNETFYQNISKLPGSKLFTCRTATHQTLRATERRYFDKTLTLLPLNSNEQLEFLSTLPDCSEPEPLHSQLTAHSQLRPLAGNPLMLEIMGNLVGLPLPTTRYDLYENAVDRLWDKNDNPKTLLSERDSVLIQCADDTGISNIQFQVTKLENLVSNTVSSTDTRTTLDELKRSGIIRFLNNNQCEFIHLTFHEFFLAQTFIQQLKQTPLDTLILEHWADSRLEETLALVIAYLLQQGYDSAVLQAIDRLINEGFHLWDNDRQKLFNLRRSPLRTALHLIQRSGCDLRQYPYLCDRLFNAIRVSTTGLRPLAVAHDSRTPAETLATLAIDDDDDVRMAVASNTSTLAETLATLATDDVDYVRRAVASNTSSPAETLATLATDDDEDVRIAVASNTSTLAETIATLATDDDKDVRIAVASNTRTLAERLATLATDDQQAIRLEVARNTSSLAETLATLATDDFDYVRSSVASNTSTLAGTLATLATDDVDYVRSSVASNTSTLAETLATLATDDHESTRAAVARNTSTLLESLV